MDSYGSYNSFSDGSSSKGSASWPAFQVPAVVGQHSQHSSEASISMPKYVEPLYDSFLCPLTKQVMEEPVSLENGQTFDRAAIQQWFKERRDQGLPLVCPVTGMELETATLRPSHALRSTIEEWKSRNEAAQLENARTVLSSTLSSDADILRSLSDVRSLCAKSIVNRRRARGLISLVGELLKSITVDVRISALTTLRILILDNNTNKEAIEETEVIRNCFKCISRKISKEREEAIHLLAELSKFRPLCESIASVNGSILILVGLTSSNSENVFIVEKAEEVLSNLEGSDQNIKQMAENGRLQPLLRHLTQGSDDDQLEMTVYLSEIVLSKEGKILVAEAAGKALVKMLDSESLTVKEAALKCLCKISNIGENASLLVEANVLPVLVRDLFSLGPASHMPMKLKEALATILANIVNSGVKLKSLPLNLTSQDVIHNLLHMISNTGPDIEGKLLQVLVGLASSREVVQDLVNSVLSEGAISSLVQFMEAPQKEIRLNCVKLLSLMAPFMGQDLADGLCGTTGQLGVLVRLLESNGMTEEHAAAASLLANLPNSNIALTRALLKEGAFHVVFRRTTEVYQGSGSMVGGGRFASDFRVGLVSILCRFTFILNEEGMIPLAQEHNLTALFTDLLRLGELDEIKKQSALALRNLSKFSRVLSKVPEKPKSGGCLCLKFGSPRKPMINLCQVHGGVCKPKDTFCLVEAGTVVLIASNLDHKNLDVVEACLGALTTLVDETTANVEGGVHLLSRQGAIPAILEIMKEHKTEALWRSSVWMIEKFLQVKDVAHFLSLDPNVHTGLVEAFRKGNLNTKQTAERALKQLNKIPTYSVR